MCNATGGSPRSPEISHFTPLSTIAYVGIEPSEVGSASGLNNTMRNLGGSIGIGTLGALFNHRYHLHFTRLAEATSKFSSVVQAQLVARQGFLGERSPIAGLRQSVATIYGSLTKESFVMAFGDCFYWIAALFFVGTAVLVFARKPAIGGASPSGAH